MTQKDMLINAITAITGTLPTDSMQVKCAESLTLEIEMPTGEVTLEIEIPTGEVEKIVNPNLAAKMRYIEKAYTDDLKLKSNPLIAICRWTISERYSREVVDNGEYSSGSEK